MKTNGLNQREFTQVKNIFKVNEKDYNSLTKIDEKLAKLTEEKEALIDNIDLTEKRVARLIKKYMPSFDLKSSDLVEVQYVVKMNPDGTTALDEKGNVIKTKKYLAKFSEEQGYLPTEDQYIALKNGFGNEEATEPAMPAMPTEGNDFDADSEETQNDMEA